MTQAMSICRADRTPVIVGVGEALDRPASALEGRSPSELMTQALRCADADGQGGWLDQIDSLDVIHSVSWPLADPLEALVSRLGISPRRKNYGPIGGETPIRFLHEAACKIASGESEVAALCGGESEHTVRLAQRELAMLPWGERAPHWQKPRDRSYLHPLARAHGLHQPVFVYPLYETACQAAWGQTPAQGRAESARLWAELSAIAADNPYAFIRQPHATHEIEQAGSSNRPIAWPYPKLMVANPLVNQGAAVIVTSLERARAAGIADHRLVYIGTGWGAHEPRDWVARENYHSSLAQDAVLRGVLTQSSLAAHEIDFFELYSCFPCVPKMARRTLGMSNDQAISVTGGLTFFGAPLNNYMTHAIAAMVGRLRQSPRACGLVYGQGEFVTKHHALMLMGGERRGHGGMPLGEPDATQPHVSQVPRIVTEATGKICIETSTVLFDRNGMPTHGVVVGLTDEHARTLARVPAGDHCSMQALMQLDRSPVGRQAALRTADDGLLECALT
ncbi:MAG: acetyl-CoA acetyltransferase [Comamonadaceae bacterium]|nr:acetyl-CoA acetyltransferase [Comamonadaceae bacterium]